MMDTSQIYSSCILMKNEELLEACDLKEER